MIIPCNSHGMKRSEKQTSKSTALILPMQARFSLGLLLHLRTLDLIMGEQRWITIGLCDLSVVVIAHTETEDEIHIISMRKAEKHEHKIFFENL